MTSENFLTTLEHEGLISIAGKDAHTYLQGLVTVDVNEINSTQYRLGACCNNKGRVVATFKLFLHEETYYFILPKLNIPGTIEHLRKYAMFSKVEIKEATYDFCVLGAIGEGALERVGAKVPQKSYECCQEDAVSVLRLPGDALARFEVVLTRECAAHLLKPVQVAQEERWKQYCILLGMPTIYPKTAMLFTPQMLNLDRLNGISLNKGCYLGQEIVARIASLGSVKKHLYVLALNSSVAPELGQSLNDNQGVEVGTILEVSRGNTRCYLSAVIQDSAISDDIYWEGTQLEKMCLGQ